MTAVYRMSQGRWTAEQAFKERTQDNFGADCLHPEFKKFVYDYPVSLAAMGIAPTLHGGRQEPELAVSRPPGGLPEATAIPPRGFRKFVADSRLNRWYKLGRLAVVRHSAALT